LDIHYKTSCIALSMVWFMY